MPLTQDLAEFCIDLKVGPGQFCVTFPGGAEFCVQADVYTPDAAAATRALFEHANTAMAPLVPVFNVVDAVVAAKECFELVPDAISDPTKMRDLIDCIPHLAQKVDALLAILPQKSIPLLAAQILDGLIAFVKAYKSQLLSMLSRLEQILRAQTRATQLGNTQLQALLDCAKGNLDVDLVNLNAQFTPLQRMIGLVNALMDLAGLPCIPFLNPVTVLSEPAIAALDKAVELLEYIRSLIPIPDDTSQTAAAFSKTCETQLQ